MIISLRALPEPTVVGGVAAIRASVTLPSLPARSRSARIRTFTRQDQVGHLDNRHIQSLYIFR